MKALSKVLSSTGVDAYNLGTGNGYSVLEMVKAFSEVNGVNVPYVIAPRRPGDVPECFADPKKAKEVLDWQAEFGLETMCKDAWNFMVKNPQGL